MGYGSSMFSHFFLCIMAGDKRVALDTVVVVVIS